MSYQQLQDALHARLLATVILHRYHGCNSRVAMCGFDRGNTSGEASRVGEKCVVCLDLVGSPCRHCGYATEPQ